MIIKKNLSFMQTFTFSRSSDRDFSISVIYFFLLIFFAPLLVQQRISWKENYFLAKFWREILPSDRLLITGDKVTVSSLVVLTWRKRRINHINNDRQEATRGNKVSYRRRTFWYLTSPFLQDHTIGVLTARHEASRWWAVT